MRRSTAITAALLSLLALVILLMLLLMTRPDVPLLWALIALPLAAAVWFLRQAVLPDTDKPTSWRVRNALGCLCIGMGVPVVFMVSGGDALFGPTGPDSFDQQGLGVLVLLGILAGMLGVITLLWGAVSWIWRLAQQ